MTPESLVIIGIRCRYCIDHSIQEFKNKNTLRICFRKGLFIGN